MSNGNILRCALVFAVYCQAASYASSRTLADSANLNNQAFNVGVSHGLDGIDLDINSVGEMLGHLDEDFQITELEEAAGTKAAVATKLTELTAAAGEDGTFFFYFSGHGNIGNLLMQDGLMKVKDIRTAMEKGREKHGPLKRLIIFLDSCHSGSFLDPVRFFPVGTQLNDRLASDAMAQAWEREFAPGTEMRGKRPVYWDNLFVFASSRADETSLAGENGSVFTVALRKAFDELLGRGTLGDWVTKTQEYTTGHHPVARFAPTTLMAETL